MGKKSPKQQTVSNEPWGPAQGYARDIMGQAQSLFNQGPTYAGFSPEQEEAMQMQTGMARAGTPGIQEAINANTATARGDYLYGGQGFNAALDAASRRILPQVNSAFARSGRSGSGLAQTAQTQALADAFASQYGQERGNQMAAIGMSPQMANLSHFDAGQLANVGAMRQGMEQTRLDSPWLNLSRYQSAISPFMGAGGTQTQPLYQNRPAGLLGGAAGGAGIAKALGASTPWGIGLTAAGALLGGLG